MRHRRAGKSPTAKIYNRRQRYTRGVPRRTCGADFDVCWDRRTKSERPSAFPTCPTVQYRPKHSSPKKSSAILSLVLEYL